MPKKDQRQSTDINLLTDISESFIKEVNQQLHFTLQRYNQAAKKLPWNTMYPYDGRTADALHTHSTAIRTMNFIDDYSGSQGNIATKLKYAFTQLGLDLATSHLTDLGLVSILGEEAATTISAPLSMLLTTSDIMASVFPEYDQIYLEHQAWLNSLSLKQQQQFKELQIYDATLQPGVYLSPESIHLTAKANYLFHQKINEVGASIIEKIRNGAKAVDEFLKPIADQYKTASEISVTLLGIPATRLQQQIENNKVMSKLINQVHTRNHLPISKSAALVTKQILDKSSLSNLINTEEKTKNTLSKKQIILIKTEITKAITQSSALSHLQQQMQQAERNAERLREKVTEQGIQDSLNLGNMLTQLGRLTKNPALYKSGVVIQHGIRIICALHQLGTLNSLNVFEKIADMQLGPISTIATAVVGILTLFDQAGPSATQLIMTHLKQVELGINKIMQNQQVILQAVSRSYLNLLNALQGAVQHISTAVSTEIKEVDKDFLRLDLHLGRHTKQIADEIRLLKLAIDQMRMQSLKQSIDFASSWQLRYIDASDSVFKQKLLQTMQTLEEWGDEFACDATFTGSELTKPEQLKITLDLVSRHFDSDIGRNNVLMQTGFLLAVTQKLLPSMKPIDLPTCNLNLWAQAITAYKRLVPLSLKYGYDPSGLFLKKLLTPASDAKQLIKLMQKNAALILGILEKRIVNDLNAFAAHAKKQLDKIGTDALAYQQQRFKEEQQKLSDYVENIPDPHLYDAYAIKKDALVNEAIIHIKKYNSFVNKANSNQAPLPSFTIGKTLSVKKYSTHEISTPLPAAFPFLLEENYRFPTTLATAYSLQVGTISSNFSYASENWKPGHKLVCNADIIFTSKNNITFKFASVSWSASLARADRTGNTIASYVLNALPLYPWAKESCTPITTYKPLACISWSYQQNTLLNDKSKEIQAVEKANKKAIAKKIQKINLPQQLASGQLRPYYESIEAHWRLFKAFSLAIGINTTTVTQLNQIEVFSLLEASLNQVNEYDLLTLSEHPQIQPSLLLAFSPLLDSVLAQVYQDKRKEDAENYQSPLLELVDSVANNMHTLLQLKNIHTSSLLLPVTNKPLNRMTTSKALAIKDHNKLSSTAQAKTLAFQPSFATNRQQTKKQIWFTWPAFILGIVATLTVPVSYSLLCCCISRRRHHSFSNALRAGLLGSAIKQATATKNENHSSHQLTPVNTINTYPLVTTDNHSLQTSPSFSQMNYQGYWSPIVQQDPYTLEPMYTFTIAIQGTEIGSAKFYAQPLLCRAEDFSRHNMVVTTGVISSLEVRPEQISTICTSLPPTSADKFYQGAAAGFNHGLLRSTADLTKKSLQKNGLSQQLATKASLLFYYSGMLATNTMLRYRQHEEISDELSRLSLAAKEALADTAQLGLMSFVLNKMIGAVQWASTKAANQGWRCSSSLLNKLASYSGYSIFAYQAYQYGPEHTAGTVAGGLLAESGIHTLNNLTLKI